MKYNQAKLIGEMYHKTGFTPSELKYVFEALEEIIVDHVRNHDEIKLFNGFSIIGVERKDRICIMPDKTKVPTGTLTSAKLKLGEGFKRAINYHYDYNE